MTTSNVDSSVVGGIIRWGANTPSGRFTVAVLVSAVAIAILVASVSGVVFGFGLMAAAVAVDEVYVGLVFGGIATIMASGVGIALSGSVFNDALGHFKETYNMAMAGK